MLRSRVEQEGDVTKHNLEETARALVAAGKGILAADESVSTITKRFDTLHIPSTAETRRAYREMLFTTQALARFISGVTLYDETVRQTTQGGEKLAETLTHAGIMPGISVAVAPGSLVRRLNRGVLA